MAAPKVSKRVKKEEKKSDHTKIGRGMSLPRGKAEKLREKKGMSSVGRWKNVPKKDFAGPDGTFPIMDIAHARNALARAHFAKDPASIRSKVYAKYPGLKKRHEMRQKGKKNEK